MTPDKKDRLVRDAFIVGASIAAIATTYEPIMKKTLNQPEYDALFAFSAFFSNPENVQRCKDNPKILLSELANPLLDNAIDDIIIRGNLTPAQANTAKALLALLRALIAQAREAGMVA